MSSFSDRLNGLRESDPFQRARVFPKGTSILVGGNIAIFVLTMGSPALYEFALFPFSVSQSPMINLIRMATHMWLHGGWSHLGFNMLALYLFGADVEMHLGTKRYLRLYFFSGVGAALSYLLYAAITGSELPIVGASGAIFGVMISYAVLFPNRKLYVFAAIPMRAKYFMGLYVIIELMSLHSNDLVAHSAHLGGAAIGILFTVLASKQSHADLLLAKARHGGYSQMSQADRDALFDDINHEKQTLAV